YDRCLLPITDRSPPPTSPSHARSTPSSRPDIHHCVAADPNLCRRPRTSKPPHVHPTICFRIASGDGAAIPFRRRRRSRPGSDGDPLLDMHILSYARLAFIPALISSLRHRRSLRSFPPQSDLTKRVPDPAGEPPYSLHIGGPAPHATGAAATSCLTTLCRDSAPKRHSRMQP
uniref:Uncharacterized protein n=1 Tax=Triticum urartu TaxID=4572 RepID=A0A8R7Q426_TRIUA